MTDYVAIALEIGRITADKNEKYGDAVGKTGDIFRILYPDGIPVEAYEDVLLIVRSLDKIVRITCGDKAAFGESPYRDLAGYSLLGVAKDEALAAKEEDPGVGLTDDEEEGEWEKVPACCLFHERERSADGGTHCSPTVPGPNPCDCTADPYSKYSYASGSCRRHGFRWVCPEVKP